MNCLIMTLQKNDLIIKLVSIKLDDVLLIVRVNLKIILRVIKDL